MYAAHVNAAISVEIDNISYVYGDGSEMDVCNPVPRKENQAIAPI